MSPTPLSWGEIGEWQRQTNLSLEPWEVRLIRHLSVAYIAEGRKAEEENCPPPWRREMSDHEKALEKARLMALDEARLRSVLG